MLMSSNPETSQSDQLRETVRLTPYEIEVTALQTNEVRTVSSAVTVSRAQIVSRTEGPSHA